MSDWQVRLLLTGGIGTGKSSVGDLLRARGALVIDADEVGHWVLEPGGAAYEQVARAWPNVLAGGVIDRSRLADIVFRDPAELRRLEAFTHAAIRDRIAEAIEQSSEKVVVVEVPLLTDFMGSGWMRVVVDADLATRIKRLRVRGMDSGDVARRIAAQPERPSWIAAADVVIDNSGGRTELEEQVDALWERLTRLPNGANEPQGDQ